MKKKVVFTLATTATTTDCNETVIITRKNEKNVVLISLESYNQLERAARNNEYLAMIDRSIAQLEAGRGQEHELINENVVMLSQNEYNDMLKAKQNADYLAMLDKSMAEAKAGGFISKSMDELDA